MAHGAILGQKLEDALLVDGSKSMQANLNMNNHKITNVTNGTSSADAVNYRQLQTKLSLSGGTMTGPINMGSNKITNLANGTVSTDAMTVGQFEDLYVSNTYINIGVTTSTGTYYFLACGIEIVFIPPFPTETSFTSATITGVGNTFCNQLFTATYKTSPTQNSTLMFVEEGDYASSGRLTFTYSRSNWTLTCNEQIDIVSQYFVFYPTEQ